MEEIQIENNNILETDEEEREYLINNNNINYRLLIILNYKYETIEFKINEMRFIPKFNYSSKINHKRFKTMLKLDDKYNNLEQIFNLIDNAYSNNKISIIDEDILIKLIINIPNDKSKDNQSILILKRNELDNNDKLDFIIKEINSIKNNNISLIEKKFNDITKRLDDIESSINLKLKNNNDNLISLKNEFDDKLLKNSQNSIQLIKNEIKDLNEILIKKEKKDDKPKEIKTEKIENTINDFENFEIIEKNEIPKKQKSQNINIKEKNNNSIKNEIKTENKKEKNNNSTKKIKKKKKLSNKNKYKITKLYEPEDDQTKFTFFIMLTGESEVGKTWIYNKFFSIPYAQSLSLGIENEEIFFKIENILMSLNIMVSPGNKIFNQLCLNSNKDLIIFVYSIDNRNSFENLKERIKEIKLKNKKDIYYILVGNKLDLESKRVVKKEEGEKLAKNENFDGFLEASAKNGNFIDDIFFEACRILYENKVIDN